MTSGCQGSDKIQNVESSERRDLDEINKHTNPLSERERKQHTKSNFNLATGFSCFLTCPNPSSFTGAAPGTNNPDPFSPNKAEIFVFNVFAI
jgi:hypothetical protein